MTIHRACLAVVLAGLGGLTGFQPLTLLAQESAAPQAASDELKIVVLEGEDSVNIVKKKTAVMPVVEVRDKNNLPVAGVLVTFSAPHSGTGVVFAHGSRSLTLTTNSAGRAAVTSMKPVGTGAFKIEVSASLHGNVATTTIGQTNTVAAGAAAGGGLSAGVIAGIVGAAAAVAVGVALAVTHGNNGKPSGTIGTGTATVGPPH